MKLDRFLAYLEYRDCVEEQKHRVFTIYRNRETQATANVGTRTEEVPSNTIVQYCRALGIPAPDVDDIKDIERRLAIIWP